MNDLGELTALHSLYEEILIDILDCAELDLKNRRHQIAVELLAESAQCLRNALINLDLFHDEAT